MRVEHIGLTRSEADRSWEGASAVESNLSLLADDGPVGPDRSSSAVLEGKGPLFAPRGENEPSTGRCCGVCRTGLWVAWESDERGGFCGDWVLGLLFISFENESERPPAFLDSNDSGLRSPVTLSPDPGRRSLVVLSLSTESHLSLECVPVGVFTGVLMMVSPKGFGVTLMWFWSDAGKLRSTRGCKVRLSFRLRSETVSVVSTGMVRVPFTWPLLVRINFNFLAFDFPDANSSVPKDDRKMCKVGLWWVSVLEGAT